MPIRCAPLLVLQVGVPAVEVGLAVEGVVHLGGVRQADPLLALILPAQLGAGEVVWGGIVQHLKTVRYFYFLKIPGHWLGSPVFPCESKFVVQGM